MCKVSLDVCPHGICKLWFLQLTLNSLVSFVILLTQIWTISYIFSPFLSHKVSVPFPFRNHICSSQHLSVGVRIQLSLLHTRLFRFPYWPHMLTRIFLSCWFYSISHWVFHFQSMFVSVVKCVDYQLIRFSLKLTASTT